MDAYDSTIMKNFYRGYCDLLDERKEVNASINSVLQEAADKAGIKKALIRKAFNSFKKLEDKQEDDLEDVVSVFQELKDD